MANRLEWSQMEAKVRSAMELEDVQNSRSAAFAVSSMSLILDQPMEDLADSITDGSQDRGIDAVFISEDQQGPLVHLFQLKCVEKFESARKHFPGKEVDKVHSFIQDLYELDEAPFRESCNELLFEFVKNIWDLLTNNRPRFVVHLVGNQEPIQSAELDRLRASLERFEVFEVRSWSLSDLALLAIENKEPQVDGDITLIDKQYFERVDGDLRGLIATVSASELVRLIQGRSDPTSVNPDVFEENVRVYLGAKNRINQQITRSAISERNHEFWYLNNGVTIVCDSYSYSPHTRSPNVKLRNFQIVNGGQTANSLFSAHQRDPKKTDEVLLLIRVYETKDQRIGHRIAESTNSQTPIKARDLRSNDDIQRRLEDSFADLGYYYERKNNQYAGRPAERRIDSVFAGRSVLAFYLGLPEVAYGSRQKIVGDLYDEIYSEDRPVDDILLAVNLAKQFEKEKTVLQRKARRGELTHSHDAYQIHAIYHLLYTIASLASAQDVSIRSEADAEPFIQEAKRIVREVTIEALTTGRHMSYNQVFKDQKTKSRIDLFIEGERKAG